MLACGSSTDQLSHYLTHFIQPFEEMLFSYILDRKHFLQLLESLPPLPENTALVTSDVASHYTNIPHVEGIESTTLHEITCQHPTPRCPKHPDNRNIIWNHHEEQQIFIHGQVFSPTCQHSHGNQSHLTTHQPLHGSSQRNHPGILIWAILFWKRFKDNIFLIFLGTTVPAHKGFDEKTPPPWSTSSLNTPPKRYPS